MRIAHASDLHLGFRAFKERLTPHGRNQREQDVSDSFASFIDQVIAADVDLVLVAGDVFHFRRPSNLVILDAMRGFHRLRLARPSLPTLIVEGNHDESHAEAEGAILEALQFVGAIVVTGADRIALPDLNAHVLCVSDKMISRVPLRPSPDAGTHVLLAHGSIGGRLSAIPGVDVLSPDVISPDFAYVGLGDYHSFEQVAPNAWYSGAIDRTSSDPWRESTEAKGWILADTEAGTIARVEISGRPYIDLPKFSAHGMSAATLTERIEDALIGASIEGAVVRQVVEDCPASLRRAIDHRDLQDIARHALYFKLDARASEELAVGRDVFVGEPQPGDPDYYEPDVAPEQEGISEIELALMMSLSRAGKMPTVTPEEAAQLESMERQEPAPMVDESEEITAFEESRIAQRIPLTEWRRMNPHAPDRFFPTEDPYAEEFAATQREREQRAAEIDAAAHAVIVAENTERSERLNVTKRKSAAA